MAGLESGLLTIDLIPLHLGKDTEPKLLIDLISNPRSDFTCSCSRSRQLINTRSNGIWRFSRVTGLCRVMSSGIQTQVLALILASVQILYAQRDERR